MSSSEPKPKADRKTPKDPNRQATAKAALMAVHYKDWEYAAQQYRVGTRSVSAIADEIGVTKEELFDFFNKEHVHKDLTLAINSRKNALLAADALPQNSVQPVSDADIISINATLQASLILQHRQDVNRARRVVLRILTELEFQSDNQEVLESLGVMMRSEDKNGQDKLNDAYQKVVGMSGRVDAIKKLSEALKICIALERQAYGINDDFEDPAVRQARTSPPPMEEGGFEKLKERFDRFKKAKATATDVIPHAAPT